MSDHKDVTVTSYGGGVTRVQHGVDDTQQQNAPSGASHYTGGCLSIDGSSGNVEKKEAMQVNMGQPQGEGILATARTRFGSPAKELTPDTLVEVGSVQMRLREAESAGLVARNDAGRYVDAIQGDKAQQLKQQAVNVQQRAPEGVGDINAMQPEPLASDVEEQLAEMVKDVPQQMQDRALIDAVIGMSEGTGVDFEQIISRTGVPAKFLAEKLGALSAQVDAVLAGMQIDSAQFVQWCQGERAETFKHAMLVHAGAKSLNGYRDLAADFLRNCTPSAESLEQAGFRTMIHPSTNALLVNYNGDWIEARAAAIKGLI